MRESKGHYWAWTNKGTHRRTHFDARQLVVDFLAVILVGRTAAKSSHRQLHSLHRSAV